MNRYLFFAVLIAAAVPFHLAQDGMIAKYSAEELVEKATDMVQRANQSMKANPGREDLERALSLYDAAARDFGRAVDLLTGPGSRFATRDYVENIAKGRDYCSSAVSRLSGFARAGNL